MADEPKWGRLAAVRRAHLNWLAEARHGRSLPDDRDGRLLLKAMLACGCTGPDAQRWAPWISSSELGSVIAKVDAMPPGYWTADRLGALVSLTDEERTALLIWSLRPSDKDWSAVQAENRMRRRERDRLRAQRKRDNRKRRLGAKPMKTKKALLADHIRAVLAGRDWTSAAFIADAVSAKRNFRRLGHETLRQAVHRALDAMGDDIESNVRAGEHGFPVRYVRLHDCGATRHVTGDKAMSQ